MKKKYYKIRIDKDHWWICSPADLKSGILGWIEEYNSIKVTTVFITEKAFNKLPEFQG